MMGLKIPNWEAALTAYIDAHRDAPFVWGQCDCVTFAIGAIEAMMGRAVEKPEFGYSTREEALTMARDYSLTEGMRAQLNAYEIAPNFHAPGDIAIVTRDGLECAHVVAGRRCYGPVVEDKVRFAKTESLLEQSPLLLRFD